jgi:Na+/proline symporter
MWLMTIIAFVIYTPFALMCGGYFGAIIFLRPMGAKGAPVDPQAAVIILLISAVFGLLILAWIIYAILMGLRYSLAIPACVVEDIKARQAIRRSIELSKGSRGRIFILGLLIVVVQVGLILIAQLFFIVAAVKSHGALPLWVRVLQQFVSFLTNSFIGPMYATGLTLFYYDQRVRKEGFDIELMMRAAGMTPPERVAESPVAAEQISVAEPWPALDAHFEPPLSPPGDSPIHDSPTHNPGSEHE